MLFRSETGKFERLGSNRERSVKVRVISATNSDIPAMIRNGQFREDLLYRLNLIELKLPPLSERTDDIIPLAQHFLGSSHKTLPSNVCVNRQPQNGNGFFPSSFSPLPILDPDVGLQYAKSEATPDQMVKRLAMLDQLDAGFRDRFKTSEVKSYTQFYDKTVSIMSSTDLEAFSLDEEADALKEKYGRNKFGQGCLLARRLVQSGVTFVEVRAGG